MRRFLLLIGVCAGGVPVAAQTWRVTTDKPVYAYGEPIRFTAALSNPGPDTLRFWLDGGPPPCGGPIAFDGFTRWQFACVAAEIEFRVPPRARLEFSYEARPQETGFPDRDGLHTLRVGLHAYDPYHPALPATRSLPDSATFEAPKYRGGIVFVSYLKADSTRLRPVRDSLRARVEPLCTLCSDGRVVALWHVEGVLLDSAVARYGADARFHTFAPHRLPPRLLAGRVVGISSLLEAHGDRLDEPAPHPFRGETRLTFMPGVSGPARAEVLDARGRRVAILYDGTVQGGVPLSLVLDGVALRPGLYLVRVTTGAGVWARRVVRAAD